MLEELNSIANINGGGLSTQVTGRYTSVRHEKAKFEGKLTAGQVAKELNKQFKSEVKFTAAELRPFATEWHHSGFYKANGKSTMGKTWFFDLEQISLNDLHSRVIAQREIEKKRAEEQPIIVYYFKVGFKKCGSGRRSYWQPVAEFRKSEIKPSELSDFFGYSSKRTQITEDEFQALKGFEGRSLQGYETFKHFKERMLSNVKSS